ncbi:lysylphosphatidylglycerol synthase transmembrane domain-containing protein [Siphonobacter sp. SORGH_AS_0500]|uniref:lysylphosphatidylglycerol synthase transmembrane domain-containing protein n=1 Tax=Siphonobacter sp. SORGH_AS_0500 TaxID=1864824 RepID=UPI00285A6826|nr:lysylphosphatidylglycerol synthase transmembrane domain-containing protein [Siphonobacter sp. SORGH_AS_0500]MDR6195589.1 uncharacterized membrane protein YbhN (UPF0104 family) [Siphonobacter sp. SORGH_AS_0500]
MKKTTLTTILKLVLTTAALGWLAYQIDWDKTLPLLQRAHWGWILLAFLIYNASQLTSTLRMGEHLKVVPIQEPFSFLIQLYYRCMFFNLFLPGGIGGDGYKVWLLRKRHQSDYRLLLSALLLDRGSGLVAITFLALTLAGFSPWVAAVLPFPSLFLAGFALVVFMGGWMIYWLFFKKFTGVYLRTFLLSILLQSLQMIVLLCLLESMGVQNARIEYGLIFLGSSLASVLPLTVGGIGVREFVFLEAANYLPIESDQAVLASLLFFLINALSSLAGALVSLPNQPANATLD